VRQCCCSTVAGWVAVCCSVLQCVAVYCMYHSHSVLVVGLVIVENAVCDSAVAVLLQCGLQCVAMCGTHHSHNVLVVGLVIVENAADKGRDKGRFSLRRKDRLHKRVTVHM